MPSKCLACCEKMHKPIRNGALPSALSDSGESPRQICLAEGEVSRPEFIVRAKVCFIHMNRVAFACGALPIGGTSCTFSALDVSLDWGTPFAIPQLGTILPLPR